MTAEAARPEVTVHLGPVRTPSRPPIDAPPGTAFDVWLAPAAVGTEPGGLTVVLHADADGASWHLGLDRTGRVTLRSSVEDQDRHIDAPVPLLRWTRVHVQVAESEVIAETDHGEVRVATADGARWTIETAPLPNESEVADTVVWYGGFTGLLAVGGTATPPDEDPAERWASATADDDPDRPRWHFMPPTGWMNEPHGIVHHGGRHHMLYQRNELGPFWGEITWGHAVSDNLVDWTDLGTALSGHDVPYAPDGIWSGSSCHDELGRPVLFFTAGDFRDSPNQRTALAVAADPEDPDLRAWLPHGEPVTRLPGPQESLTRFGFTPLPGEFRDPFVWRERGTWFQLVGAGLDGAGGTALLFSAPQAQGPWELHGPLLVGDAAARPETGVMWELPFLVPLGVGDDGRMRHLLGYSPWWDGPSEHWLQHQWCHVGVWDAATATFTPDDDAPQGLDLGGYFTGGNPSIHPDGRVLLWSITQDLLSEVEHLRRGWAGSAGVPFVLSLAPGGDVVATPSAEVAVLRSDEVAVVPDDGVAPIDAGPRWDLDARLVLPVGGSCAVAVRALDSAQRGARISVRRIDDDHIEVEVTGPPERGTRTRTVRHPLDEPVPLRVLVDHSVVEAFVGAGLPVTTRAWSTGSELGRLELRGGATLAEVHAWRLRVAEMTSSR